MIKKRKRTPTSPLQYLVDEFLFARHFEYEFDASLDDLDAQLETVKQKQPFSSVWGRTKTTYAILETSDKSAIFELDRKRGNNPSLVMAHAQGMVTADSGSGNLHVHGTIKFGVAYHLLMLSILPIGFVLLRLNVYEPGMIPFAILAWLFVTLAGWRRMYNDRNELAADMAQAFTEKQKHDFSHLEDADRDNNVLYETDDREYSEKRP